MWCATIVIRLYADHARRRHPDSMVNFSGSLKTAWLWALLAAYGVFLAIYFEPIAAGADSGGYMGSARLLSHGLLHDQVRAIPEWPLKQADAFTYVPLGFIDTQKTGRLTPTYPVGLPLHYAIAGKLAGWHWGVLLVGVAAALAAIASTYLILRELGAKPLLAVAGASTLAVSPMFLFTSLVPLSDTVATAWCATAVYLALRARRSPGWGVGCGFAISIAILVRPTNALIVPAVAIMLGTWRLWWRAALGGIPGLVFDLWYNHTMYGDAFTTGYGALGDLFQTAYFVPAVRNYLATMPHVLPFGVVAVLLIPFLPWRARWREVAGCFAWLFAFVALYAFYQYTPEFWWYLRFILPAFPAFIALGILGANALIDRVAEAKRALVAWTAIALVVIGSFGISVLWCRRNHVLFFPQEQRPHVEIPRWAKAHLPPDAVVMCFHLSSAFYFYSDFTVMRSDQFTPETFRRFHEAVAKTHRPVYAFIFEFQRDEVFRDNLPGLWHKIADVDDAGVWRLDTSG